MKTLTRTRKIGGSLMVTVPKEIVKEKSLTEGQLIEITIEKPKTDFFGAAKRIGSFKEEDRMEDRI